jgi:GTP-binding protein EngB required for normal cell division
MDISKSAIHLFQSQERLELLNDIDTFREHGLDNLPQIVVCGDTSSGKSSVLGALSGIPFPVSGTMCTRFATEIALRYSAAKSITGHAFITPAKGASESHQTGVESFRRDITSLDDIPALMDDARKKMGLGEVSGISRDVLHLKLDGQQLPNLTLVDLPGLIHASRNAEDIVMVQGLVKDYFRQEQSIILIIVSAENPIENQGVLTSSRRFDPKGTRSIGVITKPDVLERPDKASLKPAILELARNHNTAFKFTRGWHVVRCLNDKERKDGLDRDLVEHTFFGQGPWENTFHHKQLGIKSLRLALCKYLHQHILEVLPELQTSLEKRVEVVKSSLEILGDSRTTLKERMRYLTRISKRYGELVKDALEGNYSDAFFQDGDPAKRLRATTMALTDNYEHSMRTKGHSFDVCRERSRAPEKSPRSPERITQSDALLKVGKLLETYRGPELSFLFNPRLVGELFKEQSQKWPLLTSEYIGDICLAVQAFLGKVVEFICPSTGETSELIFRHVLDDAVQTGFKSLESKADELFSPYTKSFLFSTKSRLQTSLKRIERQDLQQERADTITQRQQSSGPEIMGSDYDTRIRLLQYSRAYYDVALETFIDNVVVLGVESCLLSKLEAMFTSETVVQMDDDTMNLVGGESEEMQSEREELNRQLETLDDSLKRCRRHTSRLNRSQAKEIAQFSQTESAPSKVDREGGSQQAANGQTVEEENAISESALPQTQILNGETSSHLPSTPSSIFKTTPSLPSNPQSSPNVSKATQAKNLSFLQSLAESSDKTRIFSSAKPADTSQTSLFASSFSLPSATGSSAAPSLPAFGTSLFGTRATSAPPPAAAPGSSTPLFGLPTTSTPAATAPTSSISLFGNSTTSASPSAAASTSSTSLFGNSITSALPLAAAPISSTSVFGNSTTSASLLAAAPTSSTSVFGNSTTSASLLAAAPTSSTSVFGKSATSAPPPAAAPLFSTASFGSPGFGQRVSEGAFAFSGGLKTSNGGRERGMNEN